MKYLLIFFVVILCLNSCSFVAVRIFGKIGGRLILLQPAWPVRVGERPTMHYIVGESTDRSLAVALMDELRGGVIFVEHQKLGWKPEATADLIAADVADNNYLTKILTFSIGDHVARYLESEIRSVETFAILPCSNPNFLRWPVRIWLSVLAIGTAFVATALGWISYGIPITTKRGVYSLALLADLCFAAAFHFPPETFNQTMGLVICERDRHTKPKYLEQFFGPARKVYLKKNQLQTKAKKEQAILQAYRELLAKLS